MAPGLERQSSSSKSKSKKAFTPAQSSGKDQSISYLLKSRENKRPSTETSPSGGKRRKITPEHDTFPTFTSLTSSPANMYSFASRPANGVNGAASTQTMTDSPRRPRRLSVTARVDTSHTKSGTTMLNVKNVRPSANPDKSEYIQQALVKFDEALTAIFADSRPTYSNSELYRDTENMCRLQKGAEVWRLVADRCQKHIVEDFKNPLTEAGEENVMTLQAVLKAWKSWNTQLLTIRAVFMYLDRTHLGTREPGIYETAVSKFRAEIFNDKTLKPKIVNGAYDLLLADRRGELPDQETFSGAIKMFHDLKVYSTFEATMMEKSQQYIMAWADRECAERELPEYVAEAVKFMDSETKRCEQFDLDLGTKRDLLTLLEDQLIQRKETELTYSDSVQDLLDSTEPNMMDNLGQLYSLLERRRLGSKLKPAFGAWIDLTGTAIIFDEKEQDQMVARLLGFKQKLDNIWRTSFHKDDELGRQLRDSFETFINKTKKTTGTYNTGNSKTGEMIAKYLDILMKAGAKAIPASMISSGGPKLAAPGPDAEDEGGDDDEGMDEDTEVNNQLDAVLDLFRFVHGKAVFEAFYKKDLARRLLMGRSASNDAEKNMLARLKTECGSGFTQNLEQMFKDIELARDEMNAYKERLANNERKAAIDLTVNILSASAWPSYPDVHVNIPVEIKRTIDNFENHYQQKHSGRKLQWKHALAHCQLKADFPRGKKELVVSSFQAIVLLLFNGRRDDEQLSYKYIKDEAGLTDPEIQRTLQSLACAKLRPLTKTPKGREVSPTDTFCLNTSFTHPKYRVKINAIQLKETKEENKETHVRVAADRQFETQAAIVRVMKSRKKITHAELVAEVIKATRTRGTMDVGDIKKNIDKLIEKEYMERVEGNTYEYLA